MTKSVFREEEWRNNRHLLNTSKFKEYELHASGLGFLNKINFMQEFTERFTHIDPITDEELNSLNKKTKLHLIRKELNEEEKSLLQAHGFKMIKTWGTLILDTKKDLNLDSNTLKNIRKGEHRLEFFEISEEKYLKEYHELFKDSRTELGFKTPKYAEYLKIITNKHYKIFGVRDIESKELAAGLGTISNQMYLMEVNAARNKKYFFANDYLKWKIIEYCKNNHIEYYDFAGCNPDPEPDSKDFNLRKFKEKWGGEFYYEFIFKR